MASSRTTPARMRDKLGRGRRTQKRERMWSQIAPRWRSVALEKGARGMFPMSKSLLKLGSSVPA
eukprot:2951805-Pleurochrysis_carterae.AAC.1